MTDFTPSANLRNAAEALEVLLEDAVSVSAAVAFVTHSGVDVLSEVIASHPSIALDVVARGAPITDPDALIRLRDDLGADVAVVMGAHAPGFHPKLWLIRRSDSISVLAGSGNLTRGGLIENDEQFEVVHAQLESELADAHEQRLVDLTAHSVSLDSVEGGAAWREWVSQQRRRRQLDDEARRMNERLASRNVVQSRTPDLNQLSDDLDRLYERTVAARLPRADGQRYVPNRFKQSIDRARAAGNPVPTVANICRRQSEGFDVILAADRPDLTAESLVVQETKTYHDLFSRETRRLSATRLELFPAWHRGWRPGDEMDSG
jgi:HKD family nuclease